LEHETEPRAIKAMIKHDNTSIRTLVVNAFHLFEVFLAGDGATTVLVMTCAAISYAIRSKKYAFSCHTFYHLL